MFYTISTKYEIRDKVIKFIKREKYEIDFFLSFPVKFL